MNPASPFPNYSSGFPGQARTLMQSSTFSVIPGQGAADPCKYVVKDQTGQPILWAIDAGMNPPTQRLLSLKDSQQLEVLKVSLTQASASLHDTVGNPIGTVLIAAKNSKEQKQNKDKDGKRQIILQNAMSQHLLVMSGKMKHAGANMEMKIKSISLSNTKSHKSASGDKKHKDKDKKEKDKKDKDKKMKNDAGEVRGSPAAGFLVNNIHANLSLQDRINVVGLLIGYMEVEKGGMGSMPYRQDQMPAQSYYPQGTMTNPGIQYSQQGFPAQQIPTGYAQPYQPYQMGIGHVPGVMPMGQQQMHPLNPSGVAAPMGFMGNPNPSTFPGQHPPY